MLAEQLHFRLASETVGASQPALSQQIRALETALGVRLFERTKRAVRLTAAGAIYRAEVVGILARLDAANAHAREAELGQRGEVIVGASSLAVLSHVPRIVTAFRMQYPEVTMQLKIMRSSDLFEALNARSIHVAFTRVPAGEIDIHSETLWAHPYRIILPADHWAATHEVVELSDLRDETLITYRRVDIPESFDHIIALCHDLGFDPKRIEEVAGIEPTIGLIACGFGVTILPTPWERTIGLPEVVFRPIARSDSWRFPISMCWHRDDRSALTKTFMQLSRAAT